MGHQASPSRPIIICPLQFELKALRRAGLGDRSDLECCGPGARRIQSWVKAHATGDRPVILAGLAGALTERFRAPAATFIGEVVDDLADQRWRPSILPLEGLADKALPSITSAASILVSRSSKHDLHKRTGADLVDQESTAFAAAATAAGLAWGIVRGVSDDLACSLPPESARWVDDDGGTRLGSVVGAVLRRPLLAGQLIRLQSRANRAMQGVAVLLREGTL